jgi:hypothetical protein
MADNAIKKMEEKRRRERVRKANSELAMNRLRRKYPGAYQSGAQTIDEKTALLREAMERANAGERAIGAPPVPELPRDKGLQKVAPEGFLQLLRTLGLKI